MCWTDLCKKTEEQGSRKAELLQNSRKGKAPFGGRIEKGRMAVPQMIFRGSHTAFLTDEENCRKSSIRFFCFRRSYFPAATRSNSAVISLEGAFVASDTTTITILEMINAGNSS